jgi:hypothetical protein
MTSIARRVLLGTLKHRERGHHVRAAAVKPKGEPAAVALCAVIYMNGKVLGRYAMLVENLSEALASPTAELEAVIDGAMKRGWIRRQHAHVELRAGGIYMAKEILDHPR